jgi:hypothetical protein
LATSINSVSPAWVAEAVVNHFEVVEIEKQDCDTLFAAIGAHEGALEAVPEENAVWQAGQRAMQRLVLEGDLDRFTTGGVTVDAEDRYGIALLIDLQSPTTSNHDGVVPSGAGSDQFAIDVLERLGEVRLQDCLGCAPQDLRLWPSVWFFGSAVPEADCTALELPDEDGIMCQVEQLSLLG